jgi:hypothetical protein
MRSGSTCGFGGVPVLFRVGFQIGLESCLLAPSSAGAGYWYCPISIHFRVVGPPPRSARQSNSTTQALSIASLTGLQGGDQEQHKGERRSYNALDGNTGFIRHALSKPRVARTWPRHCGFQRCSGRERGATRPGRGGDSALRRTGRQRAALPRGRSRSG